MAFWMAAFCRAVCRLSCREGLLLSSLVQRQPQHKACAAAGAGAGTRGERAGHPRDDGAVGREGVGGERATTVRPLDFNFDPLRAVVLRRDGVGGAEGGLLIAGFPDDAGAGEVVVEAQSGRLLENGALRRFINIYINDEDVRFLGSLDAQIKDGDSVTILPAVAGG